MMNEIFEISMFFDHYRFFFFLLTEEQRQRQQMLSEISSTKYTSNNRTQQKYVEPKFTMIKEPDEGTPEFLVFEISLPKQVNLFALHRNSYGHVIVFF